MFVVVNTYDEYLGGDFGEIFGISSVFLVKTKKNKKIVEEEYKKYYDKTIKVLNDVNIQNSCGRGILSYLDFLNMTGYEIEQIEFIQDNKTE